MTFICYIPFKNDCKSISFLNITQYSLFGIYKYAPSLCNELLIMQALGNHRYKVSFKQIPIVTNNYNMSYKCQIYTYIAYLLTNKNGMTY